MTFEQAVKALRPYHRQLWFCCQPFLQKQQNADLWRKGSIKTTGEKILAFQVGHPDEWALTSLSNQPDTGLVFDEPEEASEITEEFLDHVRLIMTFCVHLVHGQPPGADAGEF